MSRFLNRLFFTILFTVVFFSTVIPNSSESKSSSEIFLDLQKLGTAGSVLYIAAHPDDENTAMLAYFVDKLKLRTGYLSLTRGDGGQNLIGPEKGDLMGLIRTYELLEARKIDGAEQFFSRAIDFGYSKSVDETLDFWGLEEILKDVVRVIREFRPDVIVTRFPTGGYKTHGHHLASAILAVEAFNKAGDPNFAPEQLGTLKPWKPVRIFHNDWRPAYDTSVDRSKYISMDLGKYDPLLGKWYTEISAQSRSMHKSQGFGAQGRRGSRLDFLRLLDGAPVEKSAFEGIDISWGRDGLSKTIAPLISKAVSEFDFSDPSKSVPALIQIYQSTLKLPSSFWKDRKIEEIEELISECAGIHAEALSADYFVIPGESTDVEIQIVNPSQIEFELKSVNLPFTKQKNFNGIKVANNQPQTEHLSIIVPRNSEISNPYWLKEVNDGHKFSVSDHNLIGKPVSGGLFAELNFGVLSQEIKLKIPIVRKWVDRVKGELSRPLAIVPRLTADFDLPVYLFPNGAENKISVKIKSFSKNSAGEISLDLPKGWQSVPKSNTFSISKKYGEQIVEFIVTPKNGNTVSKSGIIIKSDGTKYTKSSVEIDYPHIPQLIYFPEASAKFVSLTAENRARTIGYIPGAGDEVPSALTQMGCSVEVLGEKQLLNGNLSKFDAIITGVRAFNTQKNISNYMTNLLNYVKKGGVMIEQYNVSFGLQTDQLGAYPFKIGRDRITVEQADLKILQPENELFNSPNKITKEDFTGWVQERGLYFASDWAPEFIPLLAGNDPGETERKGALLYAQYGKGVFIYTGISFFRQLPAGVPGAYRLFMNMISAQGENYEP